MFRTEFDTEKSDDKRSLFAAGSTELAQTYSGKHGTKRLSDNKKIDGLSNEEVVKQLNMETASSYEGAEMQTEYEIMHLKDVNKLITEVNDGIDTLQNVFEGKIKEYADKMARDFDDTDAKTHSRLIEAMVEGTSRKNYLYDTVNEAIKAENDSLIRRYASQNNKLLSRVKAEVANDPKALYGKISMNKDAVSRRRTNFRNF